MPAVAMLLNLHALGATFGANNARARYILDLRSLCKELGVHAALTEANRLGFAPRAKISQQAPEITLSFPSALVLT